MESRVTLLLFLTLLSLSPALVECSSNHCDRQCQKTSQEKSHYREKRSFVPYRTGKKVATQVSTALDHLLLYSGYDKRIRPQVRVCHLSMGSISERKGFFRWAVLQSTS